MTSVLLVISAVCLIIAGQIPKYDQTVNEGYCVAYSSSVFNLVLGLAKYSSILPVFTYLYYAGYGDLSWIFKMLIWIAFYVIIKIFGTWLFITVFGLGRGGAARSIILLILGIITFIIA